MSTATVGRKVEYDARDALLEAGWWVIRAAASKGTADLVACRRGYWLFISAKRGEGPLPPAERKALLSLAQDNGATALHVHPVKPRGLLWRELTGQAHDAWKRWEAK